jgi:hypothetical protein
MTADELIARIAPAWRRMSRAVVRVPIMVGCAALVACTAYRLPEAPVGEQTPPVRRFGVARLAPPERSETSRPDVDEFLLRVRKDLEDTGVFEAVVLDESVPATVMIQPQYGPRYCFSEPLIAAVTFGIVPQPSCYHSGYHLTLRGAAMPGGAIVIDNRSQPRRLLGWIAGPISLLPGWSPSLPREVEVQGLRTALLLGIASASTTREKARDAPQR